MDYGSLDRNTILDEPVYTGIIEMESPAERAKAAQALESRARELGVLTIVRKTLQEYERQVRQDIRERSHQKIQGFDDRITNFVFNQEFLLRHPDAAKCSQLQCGAWVADMSGISSQTSGGYDQIASNAPITIIRRLRNQETGVTQIELAWARNGIWASVMVPKSMISSASKIVSLSDYDVPVTSETAKLLVKYLAELDSRNDNELLTEISTSKLGWFLNSNTFLPYDDEIEFDGDRRFSYISESITERGDADTWMKHVLELRTTEKREIKFMMAASFASVLLAKLGSLPYIVDLWGDTEGGKTVTLMLAASIWADPDENRYIGDFKATEVALETRADLLNHLPMILDDTSKVSKRIADNFEGFVYDMCSGKGKSRSNKELGAQRENHWRNVILTNGERPLTGYTSQGGAANRILEIQCTDYIFKDPQKTASILKSHYGFAGKMFVEAVQTLKEEEIRQIFNTFYQEMASDDAMQKQAMSMASLLTADKIAEEYIFKDGITIGMEEAKAVLTDRNVVSDGRRAYDYIVEKIEMNGRCFDSGNNSEQWGVIEGEGEVRWAYLYPQALNQICREGAFSRQAAESWMAKKGLIKTGKDGKTAIVKRIEGTCRRMIAISLAMNLPDADGFLSAEELPDIPFK